MDVVFKRLFEIIDEKEEKFGKILSMTQIQTAALGEKDVNKLLDATSAKQSLIDEVDKIHDEFDNMYHECMKQNGMQNNCEDVLVLKKRIAAIVEIMHQIEDTERENKEELSKQMDELQKNIKQMNLEKKGFHAYFKSGIQNGNYIDNRN